MVKNDTEQDINKIINTLVENAQESLEEYMKLDQEKVDKIAHSMVLAAVENHVKLAKLAFEETKRGLIEDKIIKNMFASEYIWNSIKYQKSAGIIEDNQMEGYIEIAEPVGVIAGITPVTNPTSTVIFKSIICAKTRNPIIFAFHPSAQKCCAKTAKILSEAAVKAGAPKNIIQFIKTPSLEATLKLINHEGVALILATGGGAMVKSAYSAGKPALGVGPGNVPCYIEKTADLKRACTDLMISKTFDNGMICASEQGVILDKEIAQDFEIFMKENNCYFLNEEEKNILSSFVINSEKNILNPNIVGKSAFEIAALAGLQVPEDTKILIAELKDAGKDYPLSREKLSPILAYYIAENKNHAFEIAEKMLVLGGLGHSAAIHSNNNEIIKEFGFKMKVGRVIVNAPSSHGGIGDIYNTNLPSLTLGCGSYGRNSTTSNVSSVNLINKKRVAKRRKNMQWFKIPSRIYFEENSIQYLQKMENITRAFIVTDPTMVKLNYIDKILYYLRKRENYCHAEIFSQVEPDPDIETIINGTKIMKNFKPDVIIAVGGGSAIDAAKGMWLFYEHPEISFENLKLKFLDIRKKAYKFPNLGKKAKLVAIPTTSGTGSEVTSFTVISDKKKNIKYPIADYCVRPNVAIIDPQLVLNLPKVQTADTGIDVLTHALEAYVSVMASDFTDGLALQAIDLVFNFLVRAYKNGAEDREAREKMHNASCIAGMAFTNAFLGLNHSMAHKLGGEYHISHGRANSILLPHIIKYNSEKPVKFSAFPKYEKFIADKKYAKVAHFIGKAGKTTEESVENLIQAVKNLQKELNMPESIKKCGVEEEVFLNNLQELSEKAHSDQCTTANPRYPLISEIKDLYIKAFK